MRFDRDLWTVRPYLNLPAWPCPRCHQGTLEPVQRPKWPTLETAASSTARGERPDEWEPDWIEERSVGFLKCSRCLDPVALVADVSQVATNDDGPGDPYGPAHTPRFLFPAPSIIDVPLEASGAVQEALTRAFSLYWYDPSSAGNSIRTAIEVMLDQLEIPRGSNIKGKHRVRLSLHERLQRYAAREPNLTETLMAVKWLGNAATHAALTHEDVLDAFELVDHVFDEVYRLRSKTLKKRAKEINRKKGPTRPRKTKRR